MPRPKRREPSAPRRRATREAAARGTDGPAGRARGRSHGRRSEAAEPPAPRPRRSAAPPEAEGEPGSEGRVAAARGSKTGSLARATTQAGLDAAAAAEPARAPPRRPAAGAARLRHRQRGRRQRLLDQPGRPRGAPRVRRHAPQRDLDRPQAPGSARRARQDRAPEHRRRPLPARRQSQAAQGDARIGHLELRQLRRRRPEHRQRPAAPARLGPEPVDRPADRRFPQGEGQLHRPRAAHAGGGDRPGHLHAGRRLPQDPRGRPPARPHLGPPRELRGRDAAAARSSGYDARGRPRQGAAAGARRAKLAEANRRPSWPRSWASASSPSTTSSRPWAGPNATRATTCPSRSSRRASSSSKTWPPAWS